MAKETIDLKLPTGFNYQVKNGEMTLNFFCDCCGNEVKVSRKLQEKIEKLEKSFHDIFDELKKDMDGKFHRCEQCALLICQKCWDNREEKCKDCPICV